MRRAKLPAPACTGPWSWRIGWLQTLFPRTAAVRNSLVLPLALLLLGVVAQPAAAQTAAHPSINGPEPSAGAPAAPQRFRNDDIYLSFNSFCTEDEKKTVIANAETWLAATARNAKEAHAYVKAMRERIAAERKAGNKGYEAVVDQRALDAFLARDFVGMTETDPKGAQEKLDRARTAPVVDCTNTDTYEARRPEYALLEMPYISKKLCTQTEIDKLRKEVEAAYEIARENDLKASTYVKTIKQQLDYYIALMNRPDISPQSRDFYAKLVRELTDELHDASLQARDYNAVLVAKVYPRMNAVRQMKPYPCDDPKRATAPGGGRGRVPLPPPPPAPGPCPPTPKPGLPAQIRTRINMIRGEPVKYVAALEAFKGNFKGNVAFTPSRPNGLITREGVAAVDDAIGYVGMQPVRMPLEQSATLTSVAQALVDEQGPLGTTGHFFADGTGLGDRAKRLGGDIFISESISYGPGAVDEAIIRLIIDDGVPGRGHRKMLFSPEYNFIGIACGPHAKLGQMCVLDYSATPDGKPIVPGGTIGTPGPDTPAPTRCPEPGDRALAPSTNPSFSKP